jgi:8-oxo-dGTP pyrophosphatase MutT (NUDIX family)
VRASASGRASTNANAGADANANADANASSQAKVGAGAKRNARRKRRGRRKPAATVDGANTASSSGPVADSAKANANASANGDANSSNAQRSGGANRRQKRQRGASRNRTAKTNAGANTESKTAASVDAKATKPAASPPSDSPEAIAARRARAELETSAGGIVYRVHEGEALFLLIRDSYRNWGFPKGHLEAGEMPADAAVREVQEETGIAQLKLDGEIETIDWFFRFRGKLVHKVCHFFLMRTEHARTVPQREEGITACRWARFEDATKLISYANARSVLTRANAMVLDRGPLADATPSSASN